MGQFRSKFLGPVLRWVMRMPQKRDLDIVLPDGAGLQRGLLLASTPGLSAVQMACLGDLNSPNSAANVGAVPAVVESGNNFVLVKNMSPSCIDALLEQFNETAPKSGRKADGAVPAFITISPSEVNITDLKQDEVTHLVEMLDAVAPTRGLNTTKPKWKWTGRHGGVH